WEGVRVRWGGLGWARAFWGWGGVLTSLGCMRAPPSSRLPSVAREPGTHEHGRCYITRVSSHGFRARGLRPRPGTTDLRFRQDLDMPVFTPQQDAALTAVARWLDAEPGRGAPQIFRLFGYAGTGKTTLAKHIAQHVSGKVLFGAFTGKAASVMRSKGCPGATTIHAIIYQAY